MFSIFSHPWDHFEVSFRIHGSISTVGVCDQCGGSCFPFVGWFHRLVASIGWFMRLTLIGRQAGSQPAPAWTAPVSLSFRVSSSPAYRAVSSRVQLSSRVQRLSQNKRNSKGNLSSDRVASVDRPARNLSLALRTFVVPLASSKTHSNTTHGLMDPRSPKARTDARVSNACSQSCPPGRCPSLIPWHSSAGRRRSLKLFRRNSDSYHFHQYPAGMLFRYSFRALTGTTDRLPL